MDWETYPVKESGGRVTSGGRGQLPTDDETVVEEPEEALGEIVEAVNEVIVDG